MKKYMDNENLNTVVAAIINNEIENLITTIECELEKSHESEYLCDDGTIIKVNVGYVADWFTEYKEVIRKIYQNKRGG